jgi:hypothetical protein
LPCVQRWHAACRSHCCFSSGGSICSQAWCSIFSVCSDAVRLAGLTVAFRLSSCSGGAFVGCPAHKLGITSSTCARQGASLQCSSALARGARATVGTTWPRSSTRKLCVALVVVSVYAAMWFGLQV